MEKIFSLILVFLLASSTSAASLNPAPKACPGVAAIKAVGVDRAKFYPSPEILYSVIYKDDYKNKYDTTYEWSFGMYLITNTIDSELKVLKKANAAIELMTLERGPVRQKMVEMRGYVCIEMIKIMP